MLTAVNIAPKDRKNGKVKKTLGICIVVSDTLLNRNQKKGLRRLCRINCFFTITPHT